MEVWLATIEFADGERIEKMFPYTANGNYKRECDEQYRIEEYMLNTYGNDKEVVFYSVDYSDTPERR